MFGFQRRLVRRWECDTDMPQRRALATHFTYCCHDVLLPDDRRLPTASSGQIGRDRLPATMSTVAPSAARRGRRRRHQSLPMRADRWRRCPAVVARSPRHAAAARYRARACPPWRRSTPTRCATTVITFRDAMRAHAAGDQPAERLPGARRRHRHEHGPHARRRRGRAGRRADGPRADVRRRSATARLMGARGNSGVILSQILRGLVGERCRAPPRPPAPTVADALPRRVGRGLPGGAEADRGHDPHRRARGRRRRRAAAADGGVAGRRAPRRPRRRARSRWPARPTCCRCCSDAGVVDAGGAGFLLLLDAALHVVDGEPLPEPDERRRPGGRAARRPWPRRADGDGGVDVSELRYEVMYFLDLADERIEAFKQALGRDRRLDRRRRRRRPVELPRAHQRHRRGDRGRRSTSTGGRSQIRVTDLFEEVADEHARARGGDAAAGAAAPRRRSHGAAAGHLRRRRGRAAATGSPSCSAQLGVQGVVTGGQTLNPSTAELLAAVEASTPSRSSCCRTTRTSSRSPSSSTR